MPPSTATKDSLRARLGDPDTTEMPDTSLVSALEDALRQYNRYRPNEATTTLSLLEGVSIYDKPSGVNRIKAMHYSPDGQPDVNRGNPATGDLGIVENLRGLSPANNWVEAADNRSRDARNVKLYGGEIYTEAGKVVVAPPPAADVDIMIVYLIDNTWDNVEIDDPYKLEDLMFWAEHVAYRKLSSARGRVKSVSRLGHKTSFGSGGAEMEASASAKKAWVTRIARPMVGPIK